MASLTLYILLSTITLARAQPRTSNISLGSSLSPTGNLSWLSPSGHFAFGFYTQGSGYAVGIWYTRTPQKTIVWTANRDDPPIPSSATLRFTREGRLVVQQVSAQDIFIFNASAAASFASILDSGNFVLSDANSNIIWQSFDHPTDTLLSGQGLIAGNQLLSSTSDTNRSTGRFKLIMQADGNLVAYPVDLITTSTAYFATATEWAGNNVSLELDKKGQLSLLNRSTGVNFRNINNASVSDGMLYRFTLEGDGIARLYSHKLDQNGNWSFVWSILNDSCQVKGLCGENQFCVLKEQKPVCTCIPGSVPVDQENGGCRRNFDEESCLSKNNQVSYAIEELENTRWWIDETYSILAAVTREECKQACLQDCNCEAAVYKNTECKKKRLPLRIGRRDLDDDTITLVKTGIGVMASGNRSSNIVPRSKLQISILFSCVAILIFSVIVLSISVILLYKHRSRINNLTPNEAETGLVEDVSLRSFTYQELQEATNGFSQELGRGAFGTVFKGSLPNDQQRSIAVKRLEKVVAEGEIEFLNEMRSIGRTSHRNLVRLLGYCHDNSNRLLVYQYMSNGSLADFLFKSETKPSWEKRINIALNIARGILYLHEECEKQIIHCDINPNNILMDEHHCPKISDFGLAKLLMADQSKVVTGIRGTRGYVAPEWYKNQPITVKADVYSFGIVFLEIICCRRGVILDVPEEEAILAEWVRTCFESNQLRKLVSEDEVDEPPLHRMVSIGLWCIQEETSLRPLMKKVILMLEGTVEIPAPPSAASFST